MTKVFELAGDTYEIDNDEGKIPSHVIIDIIYNFRKNIDTFNVNDDLASMGMFNCQALLPNDWIVSGTYSRGFEIAIKPNVDESVELTQEWLNVESIDINDVDMESLLSSPKYSGNTSVKPCDIEDIDAFFELAKSLPDPDTFKEWKANYTKINKAICKNRLAQNHKNDNENQKCYRGCCSYGDETIFVQPQEIDEE